MFIQGPTFIIFCPIFQTPRLFPALRLFRSLEYSHKVEKILKGSLNSIHSPSPSLKIQIMGGKVCFRCIGKTLLGVVNKLLKIKSLLTMPSNVLPLHLKQILPPIF